MLIEQLSSDIIFDYYPHSPSDWNYQSWLIFLWLKKCKKYTRWKVLKRQHWCIGLPWFILGLIYWNDMNDTDVIKESDVFLNLCLFSTPLTKDVYDYFHMPFYIFPSHHTSGNKVKVGNVRSRCPNPCQASKVWPLRAFPWVSPKITVTKVWFTKI